MTDELKPCPFCGGINIKIEIGVFWKYVYCGDCYIAADDDLGESGAIENWNTRPIEDKLTAERDEARRLAKQYYGAYWYMSTMYVRDAKLIDDLTARAEKAEAECDDAEYSYRKSMDVMIEITDEWNDRANKYVEALEKIANHHDTFYGANQYLKGIASDALKDES